MFRIKRWYYLVLFTWMLTGLPIYVLGEGFAGPEYGAFTLKRFFKTLVPPVGSTDAFVSWLIPTILVLLPILLLPWAISKVPNLGEQDSKN
jgi:hypothetical protein